MNWKSEGLALAFGMLIILMVFGDATQISWVGNLDKIFGLTYWRILNVIYPVASIAVFLLYDKSKGTIHLQRRNFLLFVIFLVAIIIMQFDDIFAVLNHPIKLSLSYWTTARFLYFFTAITSFFAFGRSCKKSNVK